MLLQNPVAIDVSVLYVLLRLPNVRRLVLHGSYEIDGGVIVSPSLRLPLTGVTTGQNDSGFGLGNRSFSKLPCQRVLSPPPDKGEGRVLQPPSGRDSLPSHRQPPAPPPLPTPDIKDVTTEVKKKHVLFTLTTYFSGLLTPTRGLNPLPSIIHFLSFVVSSGLHSCSPTLWTFT